MIVIDTNSPEPLIDQIVKAIRYSIAVNEVRPGDELPAVRQLACDLGVNLNTVARAYRTLESEGLLVTARGRGTRVTSDRDRIAKDRKGIPEPLDRSIRAALADARLAGVGRDELEAFLEDRINALWPRQDSKRSK